MRKVLPLKGYKSLRAFNAFNALLLGLKMLPIYFDVTYVEFFEAFKTKSDDEKESDLRQAVSFVNLEDDEIGAMVSFCTDKNGVPFSAVNIGNLDMAELHEVIVTVCMAIGAIKIDLISDDEKKRSKISA